MRELESDERNKRGNGVRRAGAPHGRPVGGEITRSEGVGGSVASRDYNGAPMELPRRPWIGINGGLSERGGMRVDLPLRYAQAVLRAGGTPVGIYPCGGPRDMVDLLAGLDGILLSGGDDFDMARLGKGATHPLATPVPAEKQDFDVELARAALERGLPVLGVCYGMQLLALVDGGDLYQHLPEDLPGSREHGGGVRHEIRTLRGTRIAGLLAVDRVAVHSRHHQAVARTGPGWNVAAQDDQGLIEAIEKPSHPFALGVQWHPEMSPEGHPDAALFRGLVEAAGLGATRRALTPR